MRRSDLLATEEPMEIRLVFWKDGRANSESIAITMRTPGDGAERLATDFELAAGFLIGEGVVRRRGEIERIAYCAEVEAEQFYNVVSVYLRPSVTFDPQALQRHFYTSSSCGVCGKASLDALRLRGCPALFSDRPIISAQALYRLPAALRAGQNTFQRTGGLHAAVLFDANGELVSLREDVGRHNAVDKLVGERFLAGALPLSDHLLMVSGRASFEIVQKALAAGIPMVVAVGAPSSLAVDLAQELGITLVGFLRDTSFNIYAGEGRIRLAETS